MDGIEFDVWLSKDEVPMVLHGGSNGELSEYGLQKHFVFDWNSYELQSLINLGGYERIPTLEQVIQLCKFTPNMLLNIEVKSP